MNSYNLDRVHSPHYEQRMQLYRTSRILWGHPALWIGLLSVVSMFGALQRPPILPVNLTYSLAGVVVLIFVYCLLTSKGGLEITWTRSDVSVAVILLSSILSSIVGYWLYGFPIRLIDRSPSAFIGMLVLYFIVRLSLQRHEQVRLVLAMVMFGFLLQIALSLWFYFLHPDQTAVPILGEDLMFADASSFEDALRLSGLIGQPNVFVSLPLLALPLSVALLYSRVTIWQKGWLTLTAGLSLLAILLSFSRSGWIGAAISLVMLWLLISRRKGLIRALVIVLFLSLFSFSVGALAREYIDPIVTRVSSILESRSLGYRPETWLLALKILEKYPTGVGLGNYGLATLKTYSPYWVVIGRSPHASIVGIAVEGSVIAGLAMASFMWEQVRSPSVPELRNTRDEALLMGMRAAFLGLWIHSGFHSVHHHIVIWVLAACQVTLRQKQYKSAQQ